MIFCPEASDSKVGSPLQSPGSLDTLLQSIYVSQLRRNVYKGDGHPFNLLMGIPMMRDRGQLRPYPGVSCDPTRARGQLRPYPCQGSAATLPTHTFRFAWGGTWGLGLGDLGFRGGTWGLGVALHNNPLGFGGWYKGTRGRAVNEQPETTQPHSNNKPGPSATLPKDFVQSTMSNKGTAHNKPYSLTQHPNLQTHHRDAQSRNC